MSAALVGLMSVSGARLKTNRRDPAPEDACILPGRQVRAVMQSAGPKELDSDHLGVGNPAFQ